MRTSFKEYLPAVAQEWVSALVVGVIGGVVSLVLNVLPDLELSLWSLAVVGVLALATAQFRAFHTVRVERDAFAPEKTRPDIQVYNVCRHIRDEAAWGKDKDDLDTVREIRQAAMDGDIWIWGRRYTGGLSFDEDKPLVRIETDYWREHGFHEVAILSPAAEVEGTNMTRDDHHGRAQLLYSDLRLNKQQALRRWPK